MDRSRWWIGRGGFMLVVLLAVLPCMVQAQDASPTPAVVAIPPLFQQWLATYEAEDAAGFAALYTPNGVYEDVASASAAEGTVAIEETAEGYFANQNDYAFVPVSFVQSDDWAAMEYLLSATDVASGIRITNVRVATIFELEDGRIRRSSDYYDLSGVLDQLGLLPDDTTVGGTPTS